MSKFSKPEPPKESEPIKKPDFEIVDQFPARTGDVTQTFRVEGSLDLVKAKDILAIIKLSADMGFNHSGLKMVLLCGSDTFLMPAIVELSPRMPIEFAPLLGDRDIKLITR